jgi:hypothetical protein
MRASRRDVAKVSRHETWRILGVLALVLVLTSPGVARAATPAASEKPAAAPAAKSTPAATPAKTAPAKATASTPSPAKANNSPAKAPAGPTTAARPARVTSAPNVAVAAKPSAVVPARNPKAAGVATVPSIEEQVTYQYNALGRRDPFQPMIGGGFVGEDVGGDAPFDVGGMKVVGIVWGASDKFALVEDARGQSSVLRAGDKVMNGVVETLKRDAVVVNLTVDGQTETVTIPLTRKGDQTNVNR